MMNNRADDLTRAATVRKRGSGDTRPEKSMTSRRHGDAPTYLRARLAVVALLTIAGITVAGCNKPENATNPKNGTGTHTHADGTTHDDHDHDHPPATQAADHGHDHSHDEVSLGTAMIGDMEVELAQSHGKVAAGKEGHLVVKLPYSDKGETIVRAWIGTEDRTLSRVGKGDYAASHDDYDIHAMAPDPLPEGAQWWIEVEKPDGTKVVGSADFE